MAMDKWDKRFGEEYKSEGAFTNSNGSKTVEDYLWAVSNNSSKSLVLGQDFKTGYPSTSSYQFNHNVGGKSGDVSGEVVHVQEWARIVPPSFTEQFCSDLREWYDGGIFQDPKYYYLWLKWPESLSQKKDMIEKTVAASMATMGGTTENKIFINSLCGFYPTKDLNTSYYPYNTNYTYRYYTFTLTNAGAGGDYVTCAKDLNSWFYQYLTVDNKANGVLKQGPLGLVMLNHIGTTDGDHSLDLVNWIMMNNFRFPLATDSSAQSDSNGPGQGDNSDDSDMLLLND